MEIWSRLAPLILLGSLGLAAWWWTSRRTPTTPDVLTVVRRTALLRGATVAVIDVAGRHFLVGATEHSVDLLAELDNEAFTGMDAGATPTEPWTDLFARAKALVRRDEEPPSSAPA
jgi:flagellar biogenesis protein FliO